MLWGTHCPRIFQWLKLWIDWKKIHWNKLLLLHKAITPITHYKAQKALNSRSWENHQFKITFLVDSILENLLSLPPGSRQGVGLWSSIEQQFFHFSGRNSIAWPSPEPAWHLKCLRGAEPQLDLDRDGRLQKFWILHPFIPLIAGIMSSIYLALKQNGIFSLQWCNII